MFNALSHEFMRYLPVRLALKTVNPGIDANVNPGIGLRGLTGGSTSPAIGWMTRIPRIWTMQRMMATMPTTRLPYHLGGLELAPMVQFSFPRSVAKMDCDL